MNKFNIVIHFKNTVCKIREKIESVRKKHPRRFDGISKSIEVIWFLFSTFWTSFLNRPLIAGIATCLAFGALFFCQWVLLTNKEERIVSEIRKTNAIQQQRKDAESAELLDAERDRTSELVWFAHAVAHQIKRCISRMPYQEIAVTRNDVVEFLQQVLNSLEDNLSEYYNQEICCSIKLCTRPNVLKTFVRGNKNIACRGGSKRVKRLNKEAIHISKNYAYNSIIRKGLPFFAEGDLNHLSEKEMEDDKFFCEYGDRWPEFFLSTIVIPIRYFVLSGDKEECKILGIICIDSKTKNIEWSHSPNNYAYQITAFIADALYNLIEQYLLSQEESKKSAR